MAPVYRIEKVKQHGEIRVCGAYRLKESRTIKPSTAYTLRHSYKVVTGGCHCSNDNLVLTANMRSGKWALISR